MTDTYVFVVVAVVVIAAFLGVLWVRRRRSRRTMSDDQPVPVELAESEHPQDVRQVLTEWHGKAEEPVTAHGGPVFAGCNENGDPEVPDRAGEAAASTAPSQQAPGSSAPTSQEIDSEPGAPGSAARPVPGSSSSTVFDPLQAVVVDILGCPGRVTDEEWKRLEVFRLERVQAALPTIELPPDLKTSEEALQRLAQLQLYAASAGLKARMAAETDRSLPRAHPESLSARELKRKMANDILALPNPDRSDVIGFVLETVVKSNGNSQLKIGVIDTLEQLESSALVNVLLLCLDDGDPNIRAYALEAADRVLN